MNGIDFSHRRTRRSSSWLSSISFPLLGFTSTMESFYWRTRRWPFPVRVEFVSEWSTWTGQWWCRRERETCVCRSRRCPIWEHVRQRPERRRRTSGMFCHFVSFLTGILSGYFKRIFSASCRRCSAEREEVEMEWISSSITYPTVFLLWKRISFLRGRQDKWMSTIYKQLFWQMFRQASWGKTMKREEVNRANGWREQQAMINKSFRPLRMCSRQMSYIRSLRRLVWPVTCLGSKRE